MAIENFNTGSLIIPMDTTYQNSGMFLAYGLVYNLLSNGIPVKWAIQTGKAFNATDFTATTNDFILGGIPTSHAFSGGPFIIDSANAAAAAPFITAWIGLHPTTVVRVATSAFSADISSTMTRKPLIAITDANASIAYTYLNLARIPDSTGAVWPGADTDILTIAEVEAGGLFKNDLSACRKYYYDVYFAPHQGGLTVAEAAEVDSYLKLGGMLHAMCAGIRAYENPTSGLYGHYLTQTGIPADDNKGTTGTYTVPIPDFPIVQAVNTTNPQALPGGSLQTWNESDTVYWPETQVLAYFTDNGVKYDHTVAGPYKNGTGAGKIVYEGGHNFNASVPYLNNDENLYARYFFDSIFFSVSKPFLYLTYTPQYSQIYQNVLNKITFSLVNQGGSASTNNGFTVTLAPGIIYNNDATIPPTSVVGQTLTWSSAALGTVNPSPPPKLTFTANYTPSSTGTVQLATFSSTFEDEQGENYSLNTCRSAPVLALLQPNIVVNKTVDKSYATIDDVLNYTITITNIGGTATATNVFFQDFDPAGTTFDPGSVSINGGPLQPALDPNIGFLIPDIPVGGSDTVTYSVTVTSLPSPPQAINTASVDYQFTIGTDTFSASRESGPVTTNINVGSMTVDKIASKEFATIGDTITYFATITNTGNVTATNVTYVDTDNPGTAYVPGTFKLNSLPFAGDPNLGVNIGSLIAGASATVSFDVIVTSIPDPPEVDNVATVNFIYRVNPAGPDIPGSTISLPAITQLRAPALDIVKTASTDFVEVGDTFTYNFTLTNTGNVQLIGVKFFDTLPTEVTYQPATLLVNGLPAVGNPATGITIGNMNPGDIDTVSFDVLVNSRPVSGVITNTASATYDYRIDPNGPLLPGSNESNPLDTNIKEVVFSFDKTANKYFAEVGNTISYTVVVDNTGNTDMLNVFWQDILDPSTSYNPGTLKVNGVFTPGTPSGGINIGNILAGTSKTITFDVTINSFPTTNPIPNDSTIQYGVQIVPGGPIDTRNATSTETLVTVNRQELDVTKDASTNFVEVGDTFTYNFTLTNNGTVPILNAVFTDILPPEVTYQPSTLKVNGFPAVGNPALGINVGNIAVGDFATVSFDVLVTSVPASGQITNFATVDYEYQIDPNLPPTPGSTDSNDLITNIKEVVFDFTKAANTSFAQVGDIVTYTITINNTGNTLMQNVILSDILDPSTTYVPGTLKVNGSPIPGDPSNANIGDVASGTSKTVTFDVTIDTFPATNPIPNQASMDYQIQIDPNLPPETRSADTDTTFVQVNKGELTVEKSVDKLFAEPGDVLTYATTLTNTGNVDITDIVFFDNVPAGTLFVPNTLTINGLVQPGAVPSNPINIGTLNPGEDVTIGFKVTVTAPPTISEIPNIAQVQYKYRINPQGPDIPVTKDSNEVNTQIINGQVTAVKDKNKSAVEVGDTITYTITVTNTGNTEALNVTVKDVVPANTSFVTGTVTVNGDPRPLDNPTTGIIAGNLGVLDNAIVSFTVRVDSLPASGVITDIADVTFQYIVDPTKPPKSKTVTTNEVVTTVQLINVKFIKTSDKTFAALGDEITYTFNIINNSTVDITNVIFKDTIPDGTTFVQNSFIKGITPLPGEDPTIGVNLGTIPKNTSLMVSFRVLFENAPCPPVLVNIGTLTFDYQLEQGGTVLTREIQSNKTTTFVSTASFKQLFVDETLTIPDVKPDVESIIDVTVDIVIVRKELIDTPKGISNEGQVLTGKKLCIHGKLCQTISYVANDPEQSVHSAEFEVPFCTFIVVPENLFDSCQVQVTSFIEDVYYEKIDNRHIFKNVTFRLETGI